MILLKQTEEYRVNTEDEAIKVIENFKQAAHDEGYVLKSSGYTLKEKKQKGEVIDSGFLLKVVKEISTFWE